MVLKIVVSDPKDGKAYQLQLEKTAAVIGKKISEKIPGELLNLAGYELEITGGSDKVGNPMRKDLDGAPRRLLLSKGVGFNAKKKGERRKKRIAGNAITSDTVQVNMKVVKAGDVSLAKLLGREEKSEKTSEKKEVK